MLKHLGSLCHDRRWYVIGAWVAAAVALAAVAPPWDEVARDGDLEYLPANTTTARAAALAAQAFPNERARSQIVLVFARGDAQLRAEDSEFAFDVAQQLANHSDLPVLEVWTEKTDVVGPLLSSSSGQAKLVVARLSNEFMATDNIRVLGEVAELVGKALPRAPAGLEVGITGSAAIGGDMLASAAESVRNIHTTTIALVVVALLLIYRSVRLVIVPLVAIGVSASISFDLLAVLAAASDSTTAALPAVRVFTTTRIFVVVLLFGAGTDYCLFLTARFREQLRAGNSMRESVSSALALVGGALAASAATTIAGLAMMGWADFGKFAHSGPAIALCLAVMLAASITLVPALLSTALGRGLERHRPAEESTWNRLWHAVADVVLDRPAAILTASVIAAAPLAWAGYQSTITYDLLHELAPQRLSRQGTELLKRHFAVGEIGPLVVLAEHADGELETVDGQLKIAQLAKPLDDLPGVAQVRSLYQPAGDPPGSVSVFTARGLSALVAKTFPETAEAFVAAEGELAGKVTRLFLVLDDQPFSAAAVATCDRVQYVLDQLRADPQSPWYGARFELAGPTAGIRDLQAVTNADRWQIQWLVVVAVLAVILVLLRRPLVCCYLIATVVLSYLVTLGITSLVFQWARGDTYVGLDWKLPLFLFVILVAVGQDYNIYLVTRVWEEQERRGPREGLRQALVATGGIITSCGLIMAGTFVAMTTGSLRGMVEMGFALTVGILIDTFVVRSILVPAALALRMPKEPPPPP